MRTRKYWRHFCRGFLLGIGLAPIFVVLQVDPIRTSWIDLIILLLVGMISCGVAGCLLIPFVQCQVVYWFIERPLLQEVRQAKGNRRQIVQEAELTLQHALYAHYIDQEQYDALKHKLLEATPSLQWEAVRVRTSHRAVSSHKSYHVG